MMHSLLSHYQSEFENLKASTTREQFHDLQKLLLERSRTIEAKQMLNLQKVYVALFSQLKKEKAAALKRYEAYIKARTKLLCEIELERKTVAPFDNLAEYTNKLSQLIHYITHFDANIDLHFLKKLEECLQHEQAGLMQHSLFSFFYLEPQETISSSGIKSKYA